MEHHSGQLSHVRIQGFKSIQNCDITLGRINVLIGSNGAGKSNFISVFDFLQSITSGSLQLAASRAGINSLFYNGRKVTDEISMEFFFDDRSYGFELIPTDDNRLIFQKEYFKFYGAKEGITDLSSGHSESHWKSANDFLDVNRLNWRVYHFHDTSRSAKVKQAHNISNNRVLLWDASNLAAFLYRLQQNYPASYREIIETIRLIAPYFDDFVLAPQEGNDEQIILKWQQRGSEDVFNASQLSDGTLRFICLTALMLQPSALQPDTIIIDEPELGLHPYAITVFAEMAKQVSLEKQVIISTQSAELLNEFDIQDVMVVDRGVNGSEFKRLNEEELRIWLENDYALGDLWQKNLLGGRLSS